VKSLEAMSLDGFCHRSVLDKCLPRVPRRRHGTNANHEKTGEFHRKVNVMDESIDKVEYIIDEIID